MFSNLAALAYHVRTGKYGLPAATMFDVNGVDFTHFLWLYIAGEARPSNWRELIALHPPPPSPTVVAPAIGH